MANASKDDTLDDTEVEKHQLMVSLRLIQAKFRAEIQKLIDATDSVTDNFERVVSQTFESLPSQAKKRYLDAQVGVVMLATPYKGLAGGIQYNTMTPNQFS